MQTPQHPARGGDSKSRGTPCPPSSLRSNYTLLPVLQVSNFGVPIGGKHLAEWDGDNQPAACVLPPRGAWAGARAGNQCAQCHSPVQQLEGVTTRKQELLAASPCPSPSCWGDGVCSTSARCSRSGQCGCCGLWPAADGPYKGGPEKGKILLIVLAFNGSSA